MHSVIFDLDGTLADTSADLIAAANACFRGLGHGDLLDPVQDALTAFHGGRAMLRLGFARLGHEDAETLVDTQYPILISAYEADIDTHTRLYPGVPEALRLLLAAGYKLGICTNKPAGLAETLIHRLGVRDFFGALVGADTLPVRKPDPAPYFETLKRLGGVPERSFLLGDTATDRATGKAAGVPVALVTFGPEGRGVERLAPEALLDSYADLPTLAERLLVSGRD